MFDEMPKVMVTMEGETEEEELFSYYPHEVSFRAEEFIGLTKREGLALFSKKDIGFLQS